ncbi:MAG TPA: DbpA RNA binding domain-containing protein [Treponemataceae bacterium]|nr:DbpA RNA binding domain-containing protein [Treponemataceae bacterium]
MASKNINFRDEKRFVDLLKDAVVQVKTEEDPIVLNSYKKLFKKHVPLTLRTYVAAYLAKTMVQGNYKGSKKRRTDRKFDNPKKTRAKSNKNEVGEQSPRVVIDESLAATLFFSVGRNRGVYPRDLVGLVANTAVVGRERIGDIRVLDNYSFVQVYADDSQKIIDACNGTEYRNRKLTVSYSRKKGENNNSDEDENQADKSTQKII